MRGWEGPAEGAQSAYLDALRRAGAVPVIVGSDPGDHLGAAISGVVLAGGPDLDPASYGEAPHPSVYGVDPARDSLERDLVMAALAAGVPVLAICRGAQLLDVALGGTLHQHLPALHGLIPHGTPDGEVSPVVHPVEVAAGSRLAAAVGGAATIDGCVSIHHQAAASVPPGLVVTARSSDGVVEALETPAGGPWCLAVQWHPERSAESDRVQQAIFDSFVSACVSSRLVAPGVCP